MPSIDGLAAELSGKGLTVLLVNLGEERDRVEQAVRTRGYTATVVLDPDGRAARAYGVNATPTAFLVNRRLELVARAIGPRPWTQAPGRALLAAVLAAPAP